MKRAQRAAALAAMVMVADGAAFSLAPRGMIALWSSPKAPGWYRGMMAYFADHIGLCRAVAAAELALGLALLASAPSLEFGRAHGD